MIKLPVEMFASGGNYHRTAAFFTWYLRTFHDTTWGGIEHLPENGPWIMTPNHQAYIDPLLIGAPIKSRVAFMAWHEIFNGGNFERLIRAFGTFPVNTEGKDFSGFREGLERLKRGEKLIVFPEGQRTYDGQVLPFKEGVARLAIRAGGVPVIPAMIWGANHAWPRGDFCLRPWFPIHVRYLPPIDTRPFAEMRDKHEATHQLTQAIHDAVNHAVVNFKPPVKTCGKSGRGPGFSV